MNVDAPNRGLRARLAGESGVSLVEVLVAALLLVLGALATMAMATAAQRQTYRAEQSQVVSDRLQLEMEAIRRIPYASLALTSPGPVASTDAFNPNYRVKSYGTYKTFALKKNGTSEARLAINGLDAVTGGVVAPGPTPFTSGDVNGQLYRYITWMNDPACPDNLCPGSKDFKRITIAIQANETASGGKRVYEQIQSDVVDGSVQQQAGVANPTTTTEAEAIRYYLSDTACNATSPNVNPAVAPSSHDVHNTLGPCSAGVQTGSTLGAPDRLFKTNPAGVSGNFDYSTDVVTSQSVDAGLQMPVQPKQCDYAPSRSDARLQVHRWLTAPVTSGADLVLDGAATLSIWSKTINNAAHAGRLCVWLFVREPTAQGGEADTLIEDRNTGLDYFLYTAGGASSPVNWSPTWDQYSIPLSFEELQLQPGDRIGMAIAVDAAGTPGEALQFSYQYGGPEAPRDSSLTVYSTNKTRAPG